MNAEKLTTRPREREKQPQPGEAERRASVFNDEARRRQSIQELTTNDAGE
jgi:hypothetical protein